LEIYREVDRAVELLGKAKSFPARIIGHDDADGLTSASIAFEALRREGISSHLTCLKRLDSTSIKELSREKYNLYIFTDCGSGKIDEIEAGITKSKDAFAIILDHHKPEKAAAENAEKIAHPNPHLFGIDGTKEISGAGVTYLFARALNKNNKDLAALAILGALGDIQNSEGGVQGINREILKDAVESTVIEVRHDLRLFGAHSKPLHKAIIATTEPFIPGLTANESACIQFLSDIELPVKRNGEFIKLRDLSEEEKKRLTTALILKMIENGIEIKRAENIVGEVYVLSRESEESMLRDANEFTSLLNACGRFEKYSTAIALCLGGREPAYDEALKLLEEHRSSMFTCYQWISKNLEKIEDKGKFYAFHGHNEIGETFIGTVVSLIINSQLLKENKPVIGFAYTSGNEVKVSGRATKENIEKGIDLGEAMRYAAAKVGGEGGGHNIAAGAQIPKGKEEEFINYLKECL